MAETPGELALDAGEVHFGGERVDRLPVHARAQRGLKRAYQVPQFFSSFTAAGNVALARVACTRTGWSAWRRPRMDDASVFLRQGGLESGAARPSGSLRHGAQRHRHTAWLGRGEKRQRERAMAFAGEPKLLLLDEPLAGLGPGDSERMVGLL